jgi:hypothetical protein
VIYKDRLKRSVKATNAEPWELAKKRPVTVYKITNKV